MHLYRHNTNTPDKNTSTQSKDGLSCIELRLKLCDAILLCVMRKIINLCY